MGPRTMAPMPCSPLTEHPYASEHGAAMLKKQYVLLIENK